MMMVYILRCADGALYVGHTHDLEARLAAHNAGEAALFTRKRRQSTAFLRLGEIHFTPFDGHDLAAPRSRIAAE